MNIKRAKEEIKNTIRVYLSRNAHGEYEIPAMRQRPAYMERLELLGMGGTDFRPAFAYVDEMVRKRRFKKLRGLLYFTDGYGTFPVQMPLYDTAFVFMRDQYTDVDVPPWAMKVILDEEQLEPEAEEIQTEVGNDEY